MHPSPLVVYKCAIYATAPHMCTWACITNLTMQCADNAFSETNETLLMCLMTNCWRGRPTDFMSRDSLHFNRLYYFTCTLYNVPVPCLASTLTTWRFVTPVHSFWTVCAILETFKKLSLALNHSQPISVQYLQYRWRRWGYCEKVNWNYQQKGYRRTQLFNVSVHQ